MAEYMRKLMATAAVLAPIVVGSVTPTMAHADVAGEWTKCWAYSGGSLWVIVFGQPNNAYCVQLARRCTGNFNAEVHYSTNPVVAQAPYQRCTLH
jgi:hypothetical protein